MIKVAMVKKDTGEIQTIVCPSVDNLYTDGQDCGEVVARLIPFDTDAMEEMNLRYWYHGAWLTREPRPSRHSEWQGHDIGWVTVTEELDSQIRNQRGILLINSDWTQAVDSPLSDSDKALWATYRQALRDVPADNADATSFEEVSFPVKPYA